MKKRLATKVISLLLTVAMLFSITTQVFAVEQPSDIPIIVDEDTSSASSYPNEGDDILAESDYISLNENEFNTLPFPWSNTMVDADGNVKPQGRAAQSVIECNWMKYKNPKMASMGEIPWLLVQIGGRVAYCVDTFNHSTNGGTSFVEKTDFTKLSTEQKQTISYIMRYGAKSTAQDTDNILLHMATQTLIWEVVDGERAPYTLTGSDGGVYQDLVKRYPAIAKKYNGIIDEVKTWGQIPSFAERFEGNAPTHKLEGDGPYTASLENTNADCDLSLFKFTLPGVTSNISGNTLNVSSTAELSSAVTAKAERKDATSGESYIFWFDPTGKDQTRTSPSIDPVPAYFKLSTVESTAPPEEPEDEDYKIIINKYQKGTNTPLSGAQFTVKYLGGSATPTGNITSKYVGKTNSELQNTSQPSEARNATGGSPDEKHFETSVTTEESGSVTVSVPYKGIYEVRETAPPVNHKLDENFLQTVVVNKDVPTVSVDFHNEPYTGVRIQKIDAQTRAPLAGATFKLEQIDGSISRSGVSGADGTLYFKNLPASSYRVTEVSPPPNYHIAKIPTQTVELKANQTTTLVFEDEPYTGVRVQKIDAQSKVPLAGATFKLEQIDGNIIRTGITGADGIAYFENLPAASYRVTEVTPPPNYHLAVMPVQTVELKPDRVATLIFEDEPYSGFKIRKVDAHTGKGLAGAVFTIRVKDGELVGEYITDINGLIIKGDLPEGWYTITEKQAPDGYLIDTENNVKDIYIRPQDDVEVVFRDFQKPRLQIEKIDELTGKRLPGAVFKVAKKDGVKYTEVTTDENGVALLEGLDVAWYVVTEIRSPNGYLLDNTPHLIQLEAGKTATLVVTNQAKPSLKILKLDSMTKQPLQFAEFNIKIKNGKDLGNFTSDKNGEILLENCEPAIYVITEITAPDGYHILTKPTEILVEWGKSAVVTLENIPEHPLMIKKIDSKTGNALSGAKFVVQKVNGEFVGEFETGRNGYATVTGVDAGFYTIKEIKAPDGYILNGTPKTIELKRNEPAIVEFENQAKQSLMIKKIDSKTGEALLGAKFAVQKVSGEHIGEYDTDRNGYVTITGIEPGFYTVKEIKAPNGYILNGTPKIVELKIGSPAVVEFENTPLQGLQIRKVDDVTGAPLSGVQFQISKMNGTPVGIFTTDNAGTLFVPNLKEGWYTVVELKAPNGYKLDSTPRNIQIKADRLNLLEYRNNPYPILSIIKTDSDTGKPLAGVKFKLFDKYGRELGTFTTNKAGKITLTGIDAGKYSVQEVEAPDGYVLDNKIHEITLEWGKTTLLEVENKPLASLRIIKLDSVTGKPIYGVTFLLYDMKNNILGEFVTNQNGVIVLPQSLAAGRYKIKEIRAADGYVLDDTIRTIEVKSGETTEIVIKNEPVQGQIQIVKKSAEYNDSTKKKAGALLEGAVFEISNAQNKVVDYIKTDWRGVATSKMLPLGIYAIREIKAPKHYLLDGKVFYAEIKLHNDLIKFVVLNDNEDIKVDIQKFGNIEAMPGSVISYNFKEISNKSTVALDEFYFHDLLPTDALRLNKINTGTWSERLSYKVMYKTNMNDYRTLAEDLSNEINYELDCSRQKLGLSAYEYITEIKFEFGTVQSGFKQVKSPVFTCTVNADLPNGYIFTNCADVGGKRLDEWVIEKDCFTTIIYATPKGKLPKTGF